VKYLIDIQDLPKLKNKILYFYSSNLEYHEKYKQMISLLEEKDKNLNFFAINIASDVDLIKRFSLVGSPSFIIYKNNKLTNKFNGLISYKSFIKKITS